MDGEGAALTKIAMSPFSKIVSSWVRGARRGTPWQEVERSFLTSAEYRARVFARKL